LIVTALNLVEPKMKTDFNIKWYLKVIQAEWWPWHLCLVLSK